MAKAYRIRVEIDPYHVEAGCDGKPLPESQDVYEMSPVMTKGGNALSYDEYCRTYGDPDRYTGYQVSLEQQCECCGEWKQIDDIGTSLYDEYVAEGVYELDKAPKYFAELAQDMMPRE